MANEGYKKQVALLLQVLPEVAKKNCFALHGGTAINLFERNMPRLSVDIDLTYVPIESRETSLAHIADALSKIKTGIEKTVQSVHVAHNINDGKLLISKGENVKLEVNLVNRGVLSATQKKILCEKAQNDFDAFCAIDIVPFGQLYGGKICAALDRQHPRDMFDVKYLLANEGFTTEVKEGFFLRLLGGQRPIHEVLVPNFQDQRLALRNQFAGMTEEDFRYEEYEDVRARLVKAVHENITDGDKEFLLSIKNLTPDWSLYDFGRFPAIIWKIQNLQMLKQNNPNKHQELYKALEKKLSRI